MEDVIQGIAPGLSPPDSPPKSGSAHIPELDGLRGLAVLMVIFHHMSQLFPGLVTRSADYSLLRAWLRVTRAGWLGVDVFFVLSGFLISGILLNAKPKPHYYRNFITRRILRIFPLYYLILVVTLFYFGKPWHFVGLSAAFLANCSVLFGVPLVFGPLWSLSVEEHFYLIWPWVVRFMTPRALLKISAAIVLLEPFFRLVAFRQGFFNPYFSWFRFDGLACGACVAALQQTADSRQMHRTGVALLIGSGLLFCFSAPFGGATRLSALGTTLLYSEMSLSTAGIIAVILAHRLSGIFTILRSKTMRLFGDISYGLYLIHLFVILSFYRLLAILIPGDVSTLFTAHPLGSYLVHSVLVMAVSCGLAYLSFVFFESPIRSYRMYFK